MASKTTKSIAVLMPRYEREVTLVKVRFACGWCRAEQTQDRYPGSFLPTLCPVCRRWYRAWQRANHYRAKAGKPLLILSEWVERQRARGKNVPALPTNPSGASALTDGLGLLHVPSRPSTHQRPIRGSLAQEILASRKRRRAR